MRNEKRRNLIFFLQNVCCPIERIVSIDAMLTVSTRNVTELTAFVSMVVETRNNVIPLMLYHSAFYYW